LAKIAMAGRDLADDVINVKLVDTHWEVAMLADVMASPTISDTRQRIYDWVSEHGPARAKVIAEGTGINYAVIRHRVRDMVKDGQLVDGVLGYSTSAEEEDE
jgi:hypothetical protein